MSTRQVSTSSSPTTIASSITSVTLLPINDQRLGASIYNDSTATLYIRFGLAASASNFKVALVGGAYYEFPEPMHTKIVTGIWSAVSGSARVSEAI